MPGEAQIIIAKHRNGSTADVPMRFRASEARFVDADEGGFGDIDLSEDEYRVESSMNHSEFEEDI